MENTTKITVTTKEQAWAEADKIFPTDYDKDEAASANAGYAIYRHRELNPYNKICDLSALWESAKSAHKRIDEMGELTASVNKLAREVGRVAPWRALWVIYTPKAD